MRWFRSAFLVFFPAIFLILDTGCAHLGSSRYSHYSEAPQGEVFLSPPPNFRDPSFLSRWPSPVSESDKIRYLLDRLAQSKDGFIRNGEAHDGKTARQWFLYKMHRWVPGVRTAQDFLTRVASYSQRTGKPYLVETPDGKIYTLRSVLKNELFAFENYLAEPHELAPDPARSPDNPSFAHAAVSARPA